ncbi:hypothetical protein VTL71DRAFT_16396 [Oculimacula yallundae]|uniref:Uncharacterized protein n=1 Tax=Oculimacula yallundae TaxID=86028 RepID=A0ABR4CEC6_9HELO
MAADARQGSLIGFWRLRSSHRLPSRSCKRVHSRRTQQPYYHEILTSVTQSEARFNQQPQSSIITICCSKRHQSAKQTSRSWSQTLFRSSNPLNN